MSVDSLAYFGNPRLSHLVLYCIALFCFRCPEEQTQTCVTPSAWVAGITEYYRNGGGIKWDFSIDPATLKVSSLIGFARGIEY